MAKSGLFRIYILVSSIFLITHSTPTEKYCSRGLKTPGYTEPQGDIYIEYGNPLNITCILNGQYMEQYGNNASENLYFIRNDELIPNEMIEIINSSSIRLHVQEPPLSSSVYTCKLKIGNDAVCLNNVVVGTKPLPVDDFQCIGNSYETLNCTWTQPENYIKTNYNLTYTFPGRFNWYHYNCPKLTTYEESRKMSCVWSIYSIPQYRQVQKTFYFFLNMTNLFGTTITNHTFSHYQHVLSGPPENLTYVNRTTESIYLQWSVPLSMQPFPPGLQHRIIYQSEYEDKEWGLGGMIRTTIDDDVNHVRFNLTGLKFANALYDIRVSLRSNASDLDDEAMWSKNTSIAVRTLPKLPGNAPKTNIGSFEIVSSSSDFNNTTMYIYWQQIPETIKNADAFSYKVELEDSSRIIEPVEVTNAYAKFRDLNQTDSYIFHVWSHNIVGQSKEKSTIFVPPHSERIGEPISFIKISFGNGHYELLWEPPKPQPHFNEPLKNYTIFWCTHVRDRPFQCSGYLSWIEVSKDTTMYNITVSEDKVNQFAISANSETTSSGMVWSACTVIHNEPVGKLQNVWVNHIDSTYIEVSWRLDCSDRIGGVKGFVIYYCNIVKPAVRNCIEPEQNVTIYGDSTTTWANVTGLKPYQSYMFSVAVITRHTTQSQKSEYVYGTTLQEAPSSPMNVKILNVTNSSISISWQKPTIVNGKLKEYNIIYRNVTSTMNQNVTSTEYTITNLRSFADYEISVQACTVKCSEPSPIITVMTKGGYPSKISRPGVVFQNNSHILIEWEYPLYPGGNNDIFEVNFKQKIVNENKSTIVTNITDTRYTVEDCGIEYNTFYISVRAINIYDSVHYEGPWSEDLEFYCLVQRNLWLWSLVPICFFLLVVLVYMGRKMYYRCQEMRDVEIKLPSGLAPDINADIVLGDWNEPPIPEQNQYPSADEELLLVKMSDIRNLSGDSSGCSSGHESVTSSLESGTHLSHKSDSGTEQPISSSTEDFHRNSLRLRNVGASRPTINKGYVTMPTDNPNAITWSSKGAAPGSYCDLGVEPTLVTSVNPNYVPASNTQPESSNPVYISHDVPTQSSSYVAVDPNKKPSNTGYVPFNSPEIKKNSANLITGSKGPVKPALMRIGTVKTDTEDTPAYVQLKDVASNTRKNTPDSCSQHQASANPPATKTEYVTIGEAPAPRAASSDATKGYIPHRQYDAKILKED